MLVVSAVFLVAVIFSLSRMGFFCSLGALFVCAVLTLSVRAWRIRPAERPPLLRRLLPIGLVAVVTLVGIVLLPTDPLISRFSDLASGDELTADTRAQLWRDTAPLIRDYAATGCGLGTYESCFLKYKTVAPMNTADFAHNDYLQVLAEMGVLGFAAGLVFIFRILAGSGRSVVYAQTVDGRYRAIACVASFTAILLHSLVDFNMYIQANAMLFAWIAGIAASDLGATQVADDAEASGVPRTLVPEFAS
jgi:O-antigen ligase